MNTKVKNIFMKFEKLIERIDKWPLFVCGIILLAVVFAPYVIMKQASVFPWHDQLDENILNYVITARHFGENISVYPEMMSGVNKGALQPYGLLFTLFYILFDPFVAYVVSYAIVFVIGFLGMYFCVKEMTDSSIIALISAGFFAMIPFYPVYGASCSGISMVIYAVICLYKKKNRIISYLLLFLFTLTAHAVFTGYAVMTFFSIFLLVLLIKKSLNVELICAYCGMTLSYALVNYQLILENLLGKEGFISHRSEFVNPSFNFLESLLGIFVNSGLTAESYHKYLIIPIVITLLLGSVFRDKTDKNYSRYLYLALGNFLTIILIALLYAIFKSEIYVAWKNTQEGIFRYFQIDRFYWLYPALWWLQMGLCINLFWRRSYMFKYACGIVVLLIMCASSYTYVLNNSYFYMSVNQMNNGSDITEYISWEAYYSEDVMSDIERAIGKDMSTYRVVHVGMNPTPALMHGFYTIDGYTNSYPLEYKHQIRKAMEKELQLARDTAVYFDMWGNRCYLFNSQTGNTFMNGKKSEIEYSNLQYDYDLLKEMNCQYLFSCGEITDYEDEGLKLVGDFTSDTSYWHIYVYEL